MAQSVVDQVLYGSDRLLQRQFHCRCGNDISLGEHRVLDAAAERVLHEQLLQLQVVLSHDQVLLVGGDGALRAHDLNGSYGSDLCLPFGVIQRFLGVGQGFLLHANILVGVHQIPVHVFDLVHGGDDLQTESDVGNLAIVPGDADKARVGQKAETLQQVLRETKLEIRTQLRSEQAGRVVGGEVSVVECGSECASPLESLGVAEVRGVGVLGHDRDRAEDAH